MTDRLADLERGRARGDRLAAENALLRERLDDAATRAARRDRQIEHLTARLAEATERADDLAEQAAERGYQRDHTSWQLESVRASRWHRLGEALSTAGTDGARGVLASSREIRRALRARPRPVEARRAESVRSAPVGPADTVVMQGPAVVPPVVPPEGPVGRPDLTVAAIVNDTTRAALGYEWRQLCDFGPADWREALEEDHPDLLFVQSARDGGDGRWARHLDGPEAPSRELRDLIGWCREHAVPTVFWHHDRDVESCAQTCAQTCAETARLFDRVFTADAGSVPRWCAALCHDRVGVLGHAVQPRLHNPVRIPEQGMDDVVFAGRPSEALATVVRPALRFGVHLYGEAGAGSAFPQPYPPPYLPHVVGTLPRDTLLAAQKRYKIALTTADSPAQRAFELAAAGIPALSGPDPAVREAFGDLMPTVTTAGEAATLLRTLLDSPELRDRQAHLAMRKVFAEHTYARRVDTVLSTLGLPVHGRTPPISVVMPTCRPGQIAHSIEQVARQLWRPVQLVLVLHGLDLDPDVIADKARGAGIEDVVVLIADRSLSLGACLNLGLDAADGELIGKMDDDELYGPHYLSDLMMAFGYTEAEVTGKLAHYVHLRSTGATVLRCADREHRYVKVLRGGAFLSRGALLRGYRFEDVSRGEDTRLFRALEADGVKVYSADRYSFVTMRSADPGDHTWQVTDRDLMRDATVAFYGPPAEHVLL
jgi:hypothetical protein